MISFTSTPALEIPPTALTSLKNSFGFVFISSGNESSSESNSSFSIPLILLANSSGVILVLSALRAFLTILLWFLGFAGVVSTLCMPGTLLNYVIGQLLSHRISRMSL
jgi:hypothetical protein